MASATMKQWTVSGTDRGFDGLSFGEAPVPKVGEHEVLVKLQGASLNYRDLLIPKVRFDSPRLLVYICYGMLTCLFFNAGHVPFPS